MSLNNSTEEQLFHKLVGAIYMIYCGCFRKGKQWFESTQEIEPADHEEYFASGRKRIRILPKYVGNSSSSSETCTKIPYSANNMTGLFFMACNDGFFTTSLLMQVEHYYWKKIEDDFCDPGDTRFPSVFEFI